MRKSFLLIFMKINLAGCRWQNQNLLKCLHLDTNHIFLAACFLRFNIANFLNEQTITI